MPRGCIGITRQRKQNAYPCVEKIIYIFGGFLDYCDSLADGVGVMQKISNNGLLAKTLKKKSKINYTASRFSLLISAKFAVRAVACLTEHK